MDKHEALAFLYLCATELGCLLLDLQDDFNLVHTVELINLPMRASMAHDTLASYLEPEQLTFDLEAD